MNKDLDINFCQILKQAEQYKNEFMHEYVGTEHIILAILKNTEFSKKVLKFNLTFDRFYNEVKANIPPVKQNTANNFTPLLKSIILKCQKEKKYNSQNIMFHILDEGEGVAIRILLNLGIDVDALYNFLKNENREEASLSVFKYGKLLNNYVSLEEKVIGRDKEINCLIETLLRKKKNNPLLIGEAGVGKTAIVEEFTRRILNGNVPEKLIDSKIVMLEMGSLISGTRYRGEFEERLNTIINEILDNKNIILFIDEIHSMVNAGAAEGAISASDILKPYLARGDIKCIGATTKNEYEKYFSTDKALSRRFEPIFVIEPDKEQTYEILKRIKCEYEAFHNVKIEDKMLEIMIDLNEKYFPNKKNPDKSIELLDSVMSYVNLKKNEEKINGLEKELVKIEYNKIKHLECGEFKKALKENMQENKLKKSISYIKNDNVKNVTENDILDVLENKNNLILNKKCKLCGSLIKLINKYLIKRTKPLAFMVNDCNEKRYINLAKEIGYKYFALKEESDIKKLMSCIRYYPSAVIFCKNTSDFKISELVKTAVKDYLVEYEEEYFSFNNAIFFIPYVKNLGFSNNYSSDYVIDEVLDLKKTFN